MIKTYARKEYEIPDAHPAANCLPWNLDGPDFADLIESVKAGYDGDKPILTQANTELIISGRRRALACVIAGVDPVTREVDWDDEQVNSYVRRDELIRRNLTEAQRVAAIADLSELNSHGANQHKNKGKEEVSADTSSKTQKEIAVEAGASVETVKRVAAVKKSAPELLPLIREGKLEANTAARAAKELTPKQVKQIANADDPKAEAKTLLPAKPKAKTAAPKDSDPLRGGNNFDFGANAKTPEPMEEVEEAGADPLTDPDAFVAEMESVCRQIDVYLKSIRHLEKSKYAKSVMLSTAIDQIEAARKQLWVNRPAFPCEYCQGNDTDCRACRGTGRLSKDAYKRACDALGKEAAA